MATKKKFELSLKTLRSIAKEMRTIGGIMSLLNWDQRVYMPPNGIKVRGKQKGYLAELYHSKLVSKELGRSLKELEENKNKLARRDRALLRNTAHRYNKAVKISSELVKEISETAAMAQNVWEEAKRKSDFKSFEPYLAKMIKLQIRVCDKVGYKKSPYDVLLDDYEPYMTEDQLDKLFVRLRDATVLILEKIQGSSVRMKIKRKRFQIPVKFQKRFAKVVLDNLGYSFEAGRLDEAEHPFTVGISAGDSRITTHYYKTDFSRALFSTIHECGHGLYEQGHTENLLLSGLDKGISLGVHESQSRTWENIVGRSDSFWKYFLPKLKELYPSAFKGVKMEDFLLTINEVRSSLIRIYADEVTYNLHIILRYEIEKGLIKQEIKVKDLPEVWNSKMQKYLKIKPKNNQEGVLQDVHWSCGLFGYFPTYSIGNIYAAQFFAALKKDVANVESKMEKGNFKCILDWQREKIHKYGSIYTADELCQRISGKKLDVEDFILYLNEKYGQLYGF